jgi:peptide/nickel transport system substrate-binding protein
MRFAQQARLLMYTWNKSQKRILLKKEKKVKRKAKKMKKILLLIMTVVICFSLTATLSLVGCKTEDVTEEEAEEVVEEEVAEEEAPAEEEKPMTYSEAPMLAELVSSGELPPVEERLPLVPKVANDLDFGNFEFEVGKYGGTFTHCAFIPNCDLQAVIGTNEPLVNAPGIYGDIITPNIVESFEIGEDNKVFTFKLREGLRWSDGVPVTTEDIEFAWNDVWLNEELTAPGAILKWMRSANKPDGSPAVLEIVDDYIFKYIFDEPYGSFLVNMAIFEWTSYNDILKPKHYLEKYHQDYADPDELVQIMEEEGYESWGPLFNDKDIAFILERGGDPNSIGFPTLGPWMCVSNDGTNYIFERNPYYFKIDPEGNQLPYIDRFESQFVESLTNFTMKAAAGEVTYSTAGEMVDVELFTQNAEKNNFTVEILKHFGTPAILSFNFTYPDENWQDLSQNQKFRQALDYAINKEDIIETVYYGVGIPSAWNISTYDQDMANKLLDEVGLDKKDGDGFRLGPDGKRFSILIEFPSMFSGQNEVVEMITEMFKEVGIYTEFKILDFELWIQRWDSNQIQTTLRNGALGLWWQNEFGQEQIGAEYWQWYASSGAQGEEPPEIIKKYFELVSQKTAVIPSVGANEVLPEMRQINYDNCLFIVIVDDVGAPLVAVDNLRNYAKEGYAMASSYAIEQFWFDE